MINIILILFISIFLFLLIVILILYFNKNRKFIIREFFEVKKDNKFNYTIVLFNKKNKTIKINELRFLSEPFSLNILPFFSNDDLIIKAKETCVLDITNISSDLLKHLTSKTKLFCINYKYKIYDKKLKYFSDFKNSL